MVPEPTAPTAHGLLRWHRTQEWEQTAAYRTPATPSTCDGIVGDLCVCVCFVFYWVYSDFYNHRGK